MQSRSHQSPSNSLTTDAHKRLGSYLIDAGLLTSDQVTVALNDQDATGMRFGEILVARGWVKEQTIEWVMEKVIVPERTATNGSKEAPSEQTFTQEPAVRQRRVRRSPTVSAVVAKNISTVGVSQITSQPRNQPRNQLKSQSNNQPINQSNNPVSQDYHRRDIPISKPLPSVKSNDGDVNWVG